MANQRITRETQLIKETPRVFSEQQRLEKKKTLSIIFQDFKATRTLRKKKR